MTSEQAAQSIHERVVPQLSEVGFEAFILVGYLRINNDKVTRITFSAPSDNAAYQDGLRNMITLSERWGMGQL